LPDADNPWQRPEPPPMRPPEPPANRPTDSPPYTPPEPPPFKRPEPPPWGKWFRSILDRANRFALPVLVIGLAALPAVAHAQISSGTDPSTIIQAALTLILGPIGIGLATLGLIVMLLQITRFGLAGLLIYVGIVAGVFGASYVTQQILGGAGAGG
jgi:type IV secretory pathway VirB2 component (pilin)